ncbi:TPA: YcbK family protein [Pseudomonas aeruginosa]|uniref:Murein endopeptidase K n=4 Tax=Gammaproteobacteria TaxID=1236 RepID=A0A6B7PWA3_9PSED|nr:MULTISPECIES: DUF882 domain-containing protein [Pseudomonas]PYD14381.1 DUF882 domain-containing protein [Pseudomonas syringae pv. syringae]MCT8191727.1 DUF882 domain-containing protein [Pseudomonas monteilii]MDH0760313.1 DUF882 domain-containing protein [Pseudomonas juntendi]MDH1917769.1 DUF882 domain-containing protein [Pseudomonas juntendi]POF99636.1 hypothetical protein BGP82_27730 [Pseudomonas putida]
MDRRSFLHFALGLAASSAPLLSSASTFWDQPRRLWLKREIKPGQWEEVDKVYYQNGRLDWSGYDPVCRLMRDTHTGKAVQMSPVLLDIVAGVQGWFKIHGITKPIIVLSGYREESTNKKVGGKKHSAHLRGGACDLTVPGVPVDYLRRLALYLEGGGVGVYPGRNFIHVDDGNLRVWRG